MKLLQAYTGCTHGIIKRVLLPHSGGPGSPVRGDLQKGIGLGLGLKLYGARGASLTSSILDAYQIDAVIALDAIALIDSRCLYAPMEDYGTWRSEELIATAKSILAYEGSLCIACYGGHGRTGTLLAACVCLVNTEDNPVVWVREHYCQLAIESESQEKAIEEIVSMLHADAPA